MKSGNLNLFKEGEDILESILLDEIKVNRNRVDYYFTPSKGLEKYFQHNNLFVEYDTDISQIPESILVIPFVSNIMPLLWLTNSILWIKDIDRTFYDAIPNIKYAYQEMYSNFKLKGTIVAAKTTDNTFVPKKEAIQLFSGGVDAHTTFIRLKDKNPILVNIQGIYKTEITENKIYESDKTYVSEFANRFDLKSIFVRSNFMYFINSKYIDKIFLKKLGDSWWHGLQHSMAFISITIPLAYEFKVKSIYIASSFYMGYRAPCASDPTTDIQFKFATVGNTIHDGFELTRQNKIKIISDYSKQLDIDYPIRVCSFNDKNCCKCVKCFRTIAGLVAEGGDLSRFSFEIQGELTEYYIKLMEKDIHLFPVRKENEKYWIETKRRMIENKVNIKEKDFVKWFLNYDFFGNHKNAVIRYRIENFIPIVKRKIKEFIA